MPKDPLAREHVGTDTLPIAAVAISRMLADLINSLSSAPDIVEIVNRQIEQCGYRLVRTREWRDPGP